MCTPDGGGSMDCLMDAEDSSASNSRATNCGRQNERTGAGLTTSHPRGGTDAGTSSAALATAAGTHSAAKRAPSMARLAMIGRAHAQMQEQLQRAGEVGVGGGESEGGSQRLNEISRNPSAEGDACNMSEGGSFLSNYSGRGNAEGSRKRLVSNYEELSGDEEEFDDNIHWEESPEMSHGSIHRCRYNSIVGASMLDDDAMSGGQMTPPLESAESGSPPTRSGSPLSFGFHVGSPGSPSNQATLKALASAAEAERQRRRSVSILMRRASSGLGSEQAARFEARALGDVRRLSVLQTRLAEQNFRRRSSAVDHQRRSPKSIDGRRDGGDNQEEVMARSLSHGAGVNIGVEGGGVLPEDAPIVALTRSSSGTKDRQGSKGGGVDRSGSSGS